MVNCKSFFVFVVGGDYDVWKPCGDAKDFWSKSFWCKNASVANVWCKRSLSFGMSRASSVKALSCGVCKLGPSGGTALGVKVRSSATPTCPWFLMVDRNIKRQLEPDDMRPAGVCNFKYFVIQVYGTRWALSTTLFIRSYTYGNITWCYLVILVLCFFFLCHRAKRTSCTIARETSAGHLDRSYLSKAIFFLGF